MVDRYHFLNFFSGLDLIIKMAKQGNESSDLLKFRAEKSSGAIVKRFKDEYIVFDLLKVYILQFLCVQFHSTLQIHHAKQSTRT